MHCLLLRIRHTFNILCHFIGGLDVHDGFTVVSIEEAPELPLLEGLSRLVHLLWLFKSLKGGKGFVNGRLHKGGNPEVYGVLGGLTRGRLEVVGASGVLVAWGLVNIGVVSESDRTLIVFTHRFLHDNISLRFHQMELLKF
jgi:hypothetical protein